MERMALLLHPALGGRLPSQTSTWTTELDEVLALAVRRHLFDFAATSNELRLRHPALRHCDAAACRQRWAELDLLACASFADAADSADAPDDARELASVFWPGALTLVLADRSGTFPPGVRGPTGGVAVRVTSHPVTRLLVEGLGLPLTSTSANAPGGPPAASRDEAIAVARAAGAGAELVVLDAGRLAESAPSTVVDCTGRTPVVVREGATPVHRLRCVLPGIHGER